MIGKRVGQFRIEERIGAGGMGVVYRAHDERLDRDVAIKVLPPGTVLDPSLRERFRQEAHALSRLNHPNIATVHDFSSEEGVDFLVMELIPGTTLDKRNRESPPPERDILRIGIQLAEGLAAAHEQGVVHRDLKPGNLRVTPDGRLKILDFGLAALRHTDWSEKADTANLGEKPLVAGSPPYMAPEQFTSASADPRSDLYAAGVVLYEMATGRRPFLDPYGPGLIGAILHEIPVPPRQLNRQLSPGLEAILQKALSKDPDRRHQSAREMLLDLERLSMPLDPGSLPLRLVPPARRGRTLANVALLGLLALVIVFGRGAVPTSATEPLSLGSLVVLPLQNRSGDADQAYFADGMTDALIADLGRIDSLRVISRTSSMQYRDAKKRLPEIAQELGVEAVVEGSVLRDGGRVRITAQLIHAATDRQLWAHSYEGSLGDVITLQREVARSVAHEVRAHLTPEQDRRLATPAPIDPAAHEAYLRGRRLFLETATDEAIGRAIALYQEAAAKAPDWGLPPAAIAEAYVFLAGNLSMPPRDALDLARAAANHALAVDPQLGEAHAALGFAALVLERDWSAAERELRLSMDLGPRSSAVHEQYAWYLAARGRLDEGLQAMREAKALDPISPEVDAGIAAILMYKGRTSDALAQIQKTLDRNPDYQVAQYGLGRVYLAAGRYSEAVAALRRADSLGRGSASISADLALAYALSGQRGDALRQFDAWRQLTAGQKGREDQAARIHAALGERDQAIALLQQACEQRSPTLVWLKVDPRWDVLRTDDRFVAILRQMGLAG